jgi:hypothetical protein
VPKPCILLEKPLKLHTEEIEFERGSTLSFGRFSPRPAPPSWRRLSDATGHRSVGARSVSALNARDGAPGDATTRKTIVSIPDVRLNHT